MKDKAHAIPQDPERLKAEYFATHEALAVACLCLQTIATGKVGNGKHAARAAIGMLRRNHPVASDWLTDDPEMLDVLNGLIKAERTRQ